MNALLQVLKRVLPVIHSSKNAIENHFDTSFELEATLEKRIKRKFLDEVRSMWPSGVIALHVRQDGAKGLGHAVLCAKPIIDDDFVVILPEVILDAYTADKKLKI